MFQNKGPFLRGTEWVLTWKTEGAFEWGPQFEAVTPPRNALGIKIPMPERVEPHQPRFLYILCFFFIYSKFIYILITLLYHSSISHRITPFPFLRLFPHLHFQRPVWILPKFGACVCVKFAIWIWPWFRILWSPSTTVLRYAVVLCSLVYYNVFVLCFCFFFDTRRGGKNIIPYNKGQEV